MYFVIKKDTAGEYYFDAVASKNKKVLFHSEAYHNKTDMNKTIGTIIAEAADATIHDHS